MNKSLSKIYYLGLSCILVLAMGCGQSQEEKSNKPPAQSTIVAPKKEDPSTLTLVESQLEVHPDPQYFIWINKSKLSSLTQLNKLKLVSNEIGKYSFNEADLYLDPYGANDEPSFPFVQVSLPMPVLEKSENHLLISLPGNDIENRLEFLRKISEKSGGDYQRIRLRVLLTDRTKPNNPIQIIFITTVWESSE